MRNISHTFVKLLPFILRSWYSPLFFISILGMLLVPFQLKAQTMSAADRAILMELYNSTNGANWINNDNWGEGDPIQNSWYGIYLSYDGGQPRIRVSLPANNLDGPLPGIIGELTNLRWLDLRYNSISGTIPKEIGRAKILFHLLLSNNQLTGSIQDSLARINSLGALHLDNNNLTGGIPTFLGNMLILDQVYLGNNPNLGGGGVLPLGLANARRIRHFSIPNSGFTGGIPSDFVNLSNLNVLDVRNNNLSGPLPDFLGSLSGLNRVKTTGNNFEGSIPASYGNLVNLDTLHLGDNLTGCIPEELAPLKTLNIDVILNGDATLQSWEDFVADVPCGDTDFMMEFFYATGGRLDTDPDAASNTWLNRTGWGSSAPLSSWHGVTTNAEGRVTKIDLRNNGLSGTLPATFDQLPSLEHLVLISNPGLGGSLPESLGTIPGLERVYLEGTGVGGTIPSSLFTNPSLKILTLKTSSFSGEIPSTLGSSTSLEILDLQRNMLTGEIPSGLANLSNLIILSLNDNNGIGGAFPSYLSGMTNLQHIDLANCQGLEGQLPSNIGDLVNLKWFKVRDTNMDGPIPESIGQLTNLEILYLNLSNFSGSIPASIANLVNIRQLFIGENLSGCFPPELKTWKDNLGTAPVDFTGDGLFASWTDFLATGAGGCDQERSILMEFFYATGGDLDPGLTKWKTQTNWGSNEPLSSWQGITVNAAGRVTHIRLANNTLEGYLPASLNQLTALKVLDLRKNKLNSSIPPELGDLTNLIQIRLENNQLTGEIPASLGNLSKMTLLYLFGNNLDGGIPASLGNASKLVHLRLHNNRLDFGIPAELGQLSKLKSLWLFNNTNLKGEIPEELGNLTLLTDLRLQKSGLTGSIPATLGNLTALKKLYLNTNQLEGALPASLGNLTALTHFFLQNNNLSGCIPTEFTTICQVNNKNLGNNPDLSDFNTFCNTGEGTCSAGIDEICNCEEDAVTLTPASPDLGQNYILSQTYRTPSTEGAVSTQDIWEEVSYVDGLGRGLQAVSVQASPEGKDMVSPMVYDAFGRMSVEYLPYPEADGQVGTYRNNWASPQASAYSAAYGDNKAYSVTQFEESPLNRVIEQGAPGNPWQPKNLNIGGTRQSNEKTVITEYLTYDPEVFPAKLIVPYFPDGAGTSTKPNQTYTYQKGDLMVTKVRDENNGFSYTFTDKLGRVIMQSNQVSGNTYASTLNVYDKFGNVKYVFQPVAVNGYQANSNRTINTYRNNWAFQYNYDSRQRVRQKRVPGGNWVYMVYDKLDRVVLTQDANHRTGKNEWLFTKYDYLGRPIITGIYDAGTKTQNNLQNQINAHALNYESRSSTPVKDNTDQDIIGYTDQSYIKLADCEVHSITYYDDYDFNRDGSPDVSYFEEEKLEEDPPFLRVQGKVSGIQVRILKKEAGMPDFLQTVTFYDEYGRELQTQAETHLGGTDISTNEYNFAGELLKSSLRHRNGTAEEVSVQKCFSYDHRSRLNQVSQQVNEDSPVILAKQDYDPLGLLSAKSLHATEGCTDFLQQLDYGYNIRGWMTSVNDPDNLGTDLFGMQLGYNQNIGLTGTKYFNGNISGLRWKDANDEELRSYRFTYDKLNRIKTGTYAGPTGENYTVNGITYDLNGNIRKIKRQGVISYDEPTNAYGFGLMDNLTYTYRGNRLRKIVDNAVKTPISAPGNIDQFIDGANAADEYLYDHTGNIRKDLNKGIEEVIYNHLNKPTSLTFSDGNSINWIYSADGTKLKQITDNGGSITTHDYLNAFFYKDGTLEHFSHEEGRVVKEESGGTFAYEYFLKDHLGNTRVSFDATGTILQTDHYYPFGMRMGGSLANQTGIENRYRYNGKELHPELNLGWYDYGARMYDPSIARWNGVDALAEVYTSFTPYHYGLNDPINFIDIAGLGSARPNPKVERINQHRETQTQFRNQVVYNSFTEDPIYDPITGDQVGDDGKNEGLVYVGRKSDGSDKKLIGHRSQIQDLTDEANGVFRSTWDFMFQLNSFYERSYGAEYTDLKKNLIFKRMVQKNSVLDLKKNPNSEFYETKHETGYAFYNGSLVSIDAFGNINYGVAARAFGFSLRWSLMAAGIAQIMDHSKSVYVPGIKPPGYPHITLQSDGFIGPLSSYFDQPKDQYNISLGYIKSMAFPFPR